MMTPPINIVYLHSHDTGRHISPYGYALQTPHLQAFAEQGITFRQAFCNNPTCSPSRACLLTGCYAHANGMMGLAHRGGRIAEPSRTLVAVLRDHGYDTILAGLQHIARLADGDAMSNYGYTHELFKQRDTTGNLLQTDQSTADVACDFLRSRGGNDRPFFLDAGFFTTHRTPATKDAAAPDIQWHNLDASPAGDPRYVQIPPCLPDTPTIRRDYADYAESVRRLDTFYGQVLAALDEAGLRDNTLVVITTDHGLAFPNMKCNLTAAGTGVLLLMAGPGLPAGQVVDDLVSHVDLFPTLCDAVGITTPEWVQGRSFLCLLRNDAEATPRDAHVFAEVNYHAAWEPMRSVRTRMHSYIRRLEPHATAVLPNIDDSVSKRELFEAGVLDHPQPVEELYDLMSDPGEACNVIRQPRYAAVAADLRQRLDQWMHDTGDPAIAAPAPGVLGSTGGSESTRCLRVSGMLTNPRNGYSPADPAATREP